MCLGLARFRCLQFLASSCMVSRIQETHFPCKNFGIIDPCLLRVSYAMMGMPLRGYSSTIYRACPHDSQSAKSHLRA
ncbi:MAG: hypothetical protein RL591_314 [Planctomycetota bacterium]|jgi:hypothetical protein